MIQFQILKKYYLKKLKLNQVLIKLCWVMDWSARLIMLIFPWFFWKSTSLNQVSGKSSFILIY
jgi:hypothetical protein